MGDPEGWPERQQPESAGRRLGGPERVGPRPWDPAALSLLLRVLTPSLDPLGHPPSPAALASLLLQGFGGRQKGPKLRTGTSPHGDGEEGGRGIPAEPRRGKGVSPTGRRWEIS